MDPSWYRVLLFYEDKSFVLMILIPLFFYFTDISDTWLTAAGNERDTSTDMLEPACSTERGE